MKYSNKLKTNDLQLIAGGMKPVNVPHIVLMRELHQISALSANDKDCRCLDRNYAPIFKPYSEANLDSCKRMCCEGFLGAYGIHEGVYFECQSNLNDLLEGDTKPPASGKKCSFGCC